MLEFIVSIPGALLEVLVGFIGEAIRGLVFVFTFLMNVVSAVLFGCTISSIPDLVPDPADNFLPMLQGAFGDDLGNMVAGWQAIAVGLLLAVAGVMAVYKLSFPDVSQDTAGSLVAGTIAGVLMTMFAYRICYALFSIFFGTEKAVFGGLTGWFVSKREVNIVDSLVAFLSLGTMDGHVFDEIEKSLHVYFGIIGGIINPAGGIALTAATALEMVADHDWSGYTPYIAIGRMLLSSILNISLVMQMVSLAFEMMMRWLTMNMLYLASPIAGAALPSTHTRQFAYKYYGAIISGCFVIMLNQWFFHAFLALLTNFSAANVNGWGGVTYTIMLFCMLGLAHKVDEILKQLNVSTLRTANNLVGAAAAGYAGVRGATGLVRFGGKVAGFASDVSQNMRQNAENERRAGGWEAFEKAKEYSRGLGQSAGHGEAQEKPDPMVTLDAMGAVSAKTGVKRKYDGEVAQNLFTNSTGTNMPNGSEFASFGNSFDEKTGTGRFRVMNADGTVSKGTVSTRDNGGQVLSKDGHTPLYFKADKGSVPIGGALDSGMDDGTPMDAAAYREAHPQVSEDDLRAVGADTAKAFTSEADGVVAAKDDESNPVSAFSYNSRKFAGHKVRNQSHPDTVETLDSTTFPVECRADHLPAGEMFAREDYESMTSANRAFSDRALSAVGASDYAYIQRDSSGSVTLFDEGQSPIVTLRGGGAEGLNADGTPSLGAAYSEAVYAPGHGGSASINGSAVYGSTAMMPDNITYGFKSQRGVWKPASEAMETKVSYAHQAAQSYADRLNAAAETNGSKSPTWHVDLGYSDSQSAYGWRIYNSSGNAILGRPVTADGAVPWSGADYVENLSYTATDGQVKMADYYTRSVKAHDENHQSKK